MRLYGERKEDMNKKDDAVEIDLLQLMKALMRKFWAIVLAAAILGGCALVYTVIFVTPLYKSRTLLYVNNNSVSVGDAKLSISSGDLSAAQGLVDTYTIILGTRTTLDDVIETAGLSYTYEELKNMISAASVNGTQIFYVEVTSPDPAEAEKIANTIGQILPSKIASIVEGSSARIVDYAVVPARKASPSIAKNTVLGALVGFVLACGIVIVRELMDDEIHNPDYLMETYDLPVLAVIPDLSLDGSKNKYGYAAAGSAKGGKRRG